MVVKQLILSLALIIFESCVSPAGLSWSDYFRITRGQRGNEIPYTITGIDLQGSPADIGKNMGEFFLRDPERVKHIEDFTQFRRYEPGDPVCVKKLLQHHFPQLLPEMYALSRSAGIDEKMLLGMAGARFQIGGCSILGLSSPEPMLVRNYDWTPTLSENLIVSLGSHPGRLASIGMGEAYLGRLSGVNESGLSISIAAVNSSREYSENCGLSMPIIVRGVLDLAHNTDEAIRLLRSVPHSSTYNYGIMDSSGRMAVVEASPIGTSLRRQTANSFMVSTNHYLSLSNTEHDVRVFDNSIERLNRLISFSSVGSDYTESEIFNFFGNSRSGVAMSHYSGLFGTLWTIVYQPKSRSMHIRAGVDGERGHFIVNAFLARELHGILKDDGSYPE